VGPVGGRGVGVQYSMLVEEELVSRVVHNITILL